MQKQIKQLIFAMVLATGLVSAQVPKGQGYVYQGFGARDGDPYGATGAGGEAVLYKGISAGADLGAWYPFKNMGSVIGRINLNGGYHFTAGRTDTKWDPFVSAGYSFFFRSGYASGYNYGGGAVYWAKPRFGIRAEVRDHRFDRGSSFPEFRIGVSFR